MRLFTTKTILATALGLATVASGQNLMPPGEPPARPAPAEGAIITPAIQLPQWPAGFVGKPVEEQANIYRALSMATEAALTPDGFDDFIRRLSDPDRTRLKKDALASQDTELNKRIDRLREKFKPVQSFIGLAQGNGQRRREMTFSA